MIKEKKLFNSNLRKLAVFLSLFQLPGIAVTQTAEQATHIPVSEIMAAYQGLGRIPDQQVRVVDIGNNINVGVGILRRESTQTDEGEELLLCRIAISQRSTMFSLIRNTGDRW